MKDFLSRAYAFTQRHVATIAFIAGFAWDSLTLKRIDLLYENVVFISYLVIAYVAVLLIHGVETGRVRIPLLVRQKAWLPAFVQFPLGGLISGFVIFYTKSASLLTSWPFLALLLTLLVGNEFLRRRYERLIFQLGVLHFALTSYLIMVMPMVLGTITDATFRLSLISALFASTLLLVPVRHFFRELYLRSRAGIWSTLVGITIGYWVLYAANTIPPVPLALKDIGIYHSIVRTAEGYRARYEPGPVGGLFSFTDTTYRRMPREAAYCFASIFAPTDIRTKVYHVWLRESPAGGWVREDRIPYTIEGGRDEGFRGYTIKTNLPDGTWRCVVETEDGRVIGETRFTVVGTEQEPRLEEVLL